MSFLKRVQVAGIVGVLSILAAGCIFSPTPGITTGTTKKVLPPISPENVINNIAAVYELRDPVQYDSLLTDDYVFRFQQLDISQGAPDSLTRSQEIDFATNLFVNGKTTENPPASRIKFDFTISSSADDNRIGHAGWKKYIVNTTLDISFPNGNDLLVNSPAEFFFKQQPDGSGRWRLAEWQDLSGGSSAPVTFSSIRM